MNMSSNVVHSLQKAEESLASASYQEGQEIDIIDLEDDIILHKNFVKRFVNILDSNPKIDFLLLGAHDYYFSEINYQHVKDKLYKPDMHSKKLYGAHIYHLTHYDKYNSYQ